MQVNLSQLLPDLGKVLHDLIDHAVPQGNKHGELHGLVDKIEGKPDPAAPAADEPAPPAA